MKAKEIRQLNPNIDRCVAQSFLDARSLPSPSKSTSPEWLIEEAQKIISAYKWSFLMQVLILIGMLFLDIPLGICIFNDSYGHAFLVVVLMFLLLCFMVVCIVAPEEGGEPLARIFLEKMLELQDAKGGPLDFSDWGELKKAIHWELVGRVSDVLFQETTRGRDSQHAEAARVAFKSLLALCANNFKDLTENGKDERPYFKIAFDLASS